MNGTNVELSQIIWAKSHQLGCGYVARQTDLWWHYFITCTYGPAGNEIGGPIYVEGKVCSGCPKGYKNCIDGLCSKGKFIS